MKIILVPQRRDDTLSLSKHGNTLVVNGEGYDFGRMTEGSTLPREAIFGEWFDGPVEMVDGEIIVTIKLPNPWNYSQEQAFPSPITVTKDGVIELPKPLYIEGGV